MKSRLAAIGLAAIAALTVATPVSAGPPPAHRIVDDDGFAALTDEGGPDCFGGLTPVTGAGIVYSTIATAEAASANGDTIFVCPGTYFESVAVDVSVKILGPYMNVSAYGCADRSSQATVVGSSSPALALQADGVVVNGLRVANTQGTGIWTSSLYSGYRITNNVLGNNRTGVDLGSNGTDQSLVRNNCFRDNNNGGAGWGVSNTGSLDTALIDHNGFQDHRGAAIGLSGPGVSHVQITRNRSMDDKTFLSATAVSGLTVANNTVGTADEVSAPGSAIVIGGASSDITIDNNAIDTNHTEGVLIKDTVGGVAIYKNHILHVTIGISLQTTVAHSVLVKQNTVEDVAGSLSTTSVGILVGATTSGNRIVRNKVLGIADLHCQDLSTGSGTAGTANTWHLDIGLIDSPDGICSES